MALEAPQTTNDDVPPSDVEEVRIEPDYDEPEDLPTNDEEELEF